MSLTAAGSVLLLGLSSADAQTKLRAANIHGATQPYTLALERWSENVAAATDGEITISVHPSGSIVSNQQDSYSQVKLGTVDATISIAVKDDVPELQLAAFPYAFRNYEDWRAFMDGPEMAAWMEEFREKTGIRILGVQYLGARHFTANKAVLSPDDLDGMKIRAVELPIFLETIRGLGALATPVALQEVLGGLKTGVIDGQENPIPTIYQLRFFDAQDHIMLTGHLLGGDFWMMNDARFQSLTPEQQETLQEEARKAILWGDEYLIQQETDLLAELEANGMTVIGEDDGLDVDAFVEKVRANVWPKLESEIGADALATIEPDTAQ
ncbi:TRAP transporter substrate-binding protein [Acuticoccus sp. M5D2P5]|uniref:TRAP transporter substrate-binding protein n=1 Tax=Acuticoccus kalidii TaxID=2910977 RepID=UPI001F3FD88A|nr:TRAP transporter substrate-binding protein [Acuticoccus kalidii]MCF3933721.1 TRAP transporter substrate-binding protein [Acuticoccus kalidii]